MLEWPSNTHHQDLNENLTSYFEVITHMWLAFIPESWQIVLEHLGTLLIRDLNEKKNMILQKVSITLNMWILYIECVDYRDVYKCYLYKMIRGIYIRWFHLFMRIQILLYKIVNNQRRILANSTFVNNNNKIINNFIIRITSSR